jgi:hypothetical protein
MNLNNHAYVVQNAPPVNGTPKTLEIGTCMLGDTWGEIIGCSLTDSADVKEIMGCLMETRAVLISNMAQECGIETLFDVSVPLPRVGDVFMIPYLSVEALVLPGTEIIWTRGDSRSLKFKLKHWNSLDLTNWRSTTAAGAKVYKFGGSNYIQQVENSSE